MTKAAANAAGKQRGKPFQAGQSGNPAGKAKGTRNKITIAAEVLLESEAKALTQKAIDMAKGGDAQALRLCLERIMPPRKDRAIRFTLPPIKAPEDAQQALSSILAAVAAGDITPMEADAVVRLVDSFMRTIEITDLEKRVANLEEKRVREMI